MTTQIRNEVLLEGVALETPSLSHENHSTRFYRFPLQVPRLSGQVDVLPVLLPEPQLAQVKEGADIRIQGQLRSFNNRSGVGSRLVLTVYAQRLSPGLDEPCNQILLSGTLCKPPVFRRTPLGRSICDLMLAVPRKYGRADYLPVIAWGQLAVRAGRLQVGDFLALEGRVQSRTYHKVTDLGTEERVAYEVSMMHLLENAPAEEPEL
ncbi:single-stranded DNA-binding protein [Oscillibacter sp. 1-3]|uniref:single-stranded DNA-binding protein n=1 Tax=Oscillibacter sp. 1-3 TaxID=1235797 RepID=UPI00033C868F|nr:single-stranded DNA-binding protein [Oscillibacter sp. 1-3]EOS63855.1 hypothetical protein C816_03629 [Oscillibacter sp. 1-3]